MLALSIVSPHGSNIASGKKTIEVRAWRPESLPIRDLLIVENSNFLSAQNPVDLNGRAVAIVDVEEIHEWLPSEVKAACSSGWESGYWAWRLSNVRPVISEILVPARRKLYEIDLCMGKPKNRLMCDCKGSLYICVTFGQQRGLNRHANALLIRSSSALCDKLRTNKVSDIIVIEMLQGVKREKDQGIC